MFDLETIEAINTPGYKWQHTEPITSKPAQPMLHRIYTEDKNRSGIYAVLDSWFAGYTVSEATGAWKGVRENSLVIELVDSDNTLLPLVEAVSDAIKAANGQESILVVSIPCSVSFR